MTPMTDYEEIHSNVEAELRTLQAEKEQLVRQRQNIEQRLEVINRHEEKLRRIVESLADLLAVNPPLQTSAQTTEIDSAMLAADAVEPSVVVQPEPQGIMDGSTTQEETAAPTDTRALSGTEPEASFPPIEANESSASPAQELGDEQNGTGAATVSLDDTAVVLNRADPNEEAVLRQVADFDPQDFFNRFPYITTTHPVHFQAGKLLEYFGYGLKLAEIARLIGLLGYRHNSRNFTDSVHSALKNKRKTTGEFRFNARKSVWELSHWAGNNPETDSSFKPEEVEAAAPPQQEQTKDGLQRVALGRRETAKLVNKKGAAKSGANRPVRVLKSQK